MHDKEATARVEAAWMICLGPTNVDSACGFDWRSHAAWYATEPISTRYEAANYLNLHHLPIGPPIYWTETESAAEHGRYPTIINE